MQVFGHKGIHCTDFIGPRSNIRELPESSDVMTVHPKGGRMSVQNYMETHPLDVDFTPQKITQ